MKNLFSLDNPVMRFLDQIADLIILNLLFIVCSIPLITLGASVTAMCYVTLKMRDGEEGSVFRNFFKAFRQNFVQATLIWIILAALAGFLAADHLLIRDLEGTGYQVIRILLPLCAILWGMVTLCVFFIQARFQNTVPNTLRNALALAFINAPRCFLAVAVLVAAWRLVTFDTDTLSLGILIFLAIGFSGLAKLNCWLLCRKVEGLAPKPKDKNIK